MQRLVPLAVVILSAAGVVACGSDPKPEPKTATTAAPTAKATAGPASSAGGGATDPNKGPESTASNVRIDSAILKACGIPEPEAHFGFDSAALRPQDTLPLDKVATCFLTGPLKGRGLRIVGRADPRGGHEYNMLLGQKRADAVQGYFLTKGMDRKNAESTTRGAMDAEGHDESGWAQDRRVDVLLAQ